MAFVLEKIRPIRKRKKAAFECPSEPTAEKVLRLAASVLRRGNRSRIVVRTENGVVIDTSVTAGVLAAIASPRLILLGIAAVLLSPWEIEVSKPRALEE